MYAKSKPTTASYTEVTTTPATTTLRCGYAVWMPAVYWMKNDVIHILFLCYSGCKKVTARFWCSWTHLSCDTRPMKGNTIAGPQPNSRLVSYTMSATPPLLLLPASSTGSRCCIAFASCDLPPRTHNLHKLTTSRPPQTHDLHKLTTSTNSRPTQTHDLHKS